MRYLLPTTGRTARSLQSGIIIITARPRVFDHVYGTGNNQSNTHGLNDKRGVAGPKMATEVIISKRCKKPVSFLAL